MSDPIQPTFLQQAVQRLLKDEALAISALDDLPMELFPPLFKEAFTGRQTNMVRAMVAAWPFHCLPMGTLMRDVLLTHGDIEGCSPGTGYSGYTQGSPQVSKTLLRILQVLSGAN